MSIKLNYGQAVELAELVVETAGPDFVYHRPYFPPASEGRFNDRPPTGSYCAYYGPNGDPSCIVGHILYRLGLRYEPQDQKNFHGAALICSPSGDVECDRKTVHFLCRLQEMQDNGIAWGACLTMAKLAAERFDKGDLAETKRSHAYLDANGLATATSGWEIVVEETAHA